MDSSTNHHHTLKGVLLLLKGDLKRRVEYEDKGHSLYQNLICSLQPAFHAILLHRLAHYFFLNHLKILARFIYLFNSMWSGADISSSTKIGRNFLLLHSQTVIICGVIGDNVTLTAFNGLGGDGSINDIGAGPGLPYLGDRCSLKPGGVVWGPCHTGNDCIISEGVIWRKNAPDHSFVAGFPVAKATPRSEMCQ